MNEPFSPFASTYFSKKPKKVERITFWYECQYHHCNQHELIAKNIKVENTFKKLIFENLPKPSSHLVKSYNRLLHSDDFFCKIFAKMLRAQLSVWPKLPVRTSDTAFVIMLLIRVFVVYPRGWALLNRCVHCYFIVSDVSQIKDIDDFRDKSI